MKSLTGEALSQPRREIVFLLHGWFAGRIEMKRLEHHLLRSGYDVVNVGYPSVRVPIRELADNGLPRLLDPHLSDISSKTHFVTHSMGGILLRLYLEKHPLPNLGRVVMLGPPNHGSELADRWSRIPGVRWIAGANLSELRTTGITRSLPAPKFELGIIAGEVSCLKPLSPLPPPHDGKVSVASTLLSGMADHTTVRSGHTMLPWRQETLDLTIRFLKTGAFERRKTERASFAVP